MKRWWIIGIAVVCILLLAGVHLWNSSMNLPTPPHSTLEALLPEGEPMASWQARLEQAAEENPDSTGLRHLAQALSLTAGRVDGNLNQALGAAVRTDWDQVDPQCVQALSDHSDTISAALLAIDALPFTLPEHRHPLTPGPMALEFGALVRLLTLDALRLEAEGQSAEAVERVLGAIRLCDAFCGENQPIISHLVGLAAMRDALNVLSTLLVSPNVSEDSVRAVADALAELDGGQVSLAGAIHVEGEGRLMIFAMSIYDPVMRAQWWSRVRNDWPHRDAVRRAIRNPDELADLIRAAAEWAATEVAKPPWERRAIVPPFVEQSIYRDLLLVTVVDVGRLGGTHDHTLARLRLARAQCAIRLGEGIESITDPFSGQAIKSGDGLVSSVGPDFTTGTDGIAYDPTNGTGSAGDITAPLPQD